MKKLCRYPDKGYLGGVCHGLAIHTNIDPILWRALTVFSGLVIVYIILWIFVPKPPKEINAK
jgi:phage shock protein PspC (stress-responsive transcriptional regulator)